jgi:TRAP-type C4-dicarboxylate transport system permease large subunit
MKTEMAVIMPPVGLNLYTLKSAVPELTLKEIVTGCLPYLGIELFALLLFLFVPEIALWLPEMMK